MISLISKSGGSKSSVERANHRRLDRQVKELVIENLKRTKRNSFKSINKWGLLGSMPIWILYAMF